MFCLIQDIVMWYISYIQALCLFVGWQNELFDAHKFKNFYLHVDETQNDIIFCCSGSDTFSRHTNLQ